MLENILLVITGSLTGLLAGVFFGYAVSVNWGLHRLQDIEYVRAMQSINVVILNPLFFLSFLGPVVLLPTVTFLSRGSDSGRFELLLAASLLYILFSFVLTVRGNVPLNNQLAAFDSSTASDKQIADARAHYEGPWNRLHAIRTVASLAAMALIFVACVRTS